MQVYRDLRVLTARPSPVEERQAPHLLFGEIDGAVNFSVGRYEARAREILASAGAAGFRRRHRALFPCADQGLSDIPAIPEAVRAQVRARPRVGRRRAARRTRPPRSRRRRAAAAVRPATAAARARSFHATGRSLTAFQNHRGAPALAAGEWRGLFLAPDREALKRRIAARFAAMLEAGALDEVARLAARNLDPALPVMRAHGAPHLMAHLRGEITLDAAAALGVRDTVAYAKRQFTWARHQLKEFVWTSPESGRAGARVLRMTAQRRARRPAGTARVSRALCRRPRAERAGWKPAVPGATPWRLMLKPSVDS